MPVVAGCPLRWLLPIERAWSMPVAANRPYHRLPIERDRSMPVSCRSSTSLAADRVDPIHASGCRSTGVLMEPARSMPASAGRLHC